MIHGSCHDLRNGVLRLGVLLGRCKDTIRGALPNQVKCTSF